VVLPGFRNKVAPIEAENGMLEVRTEDQEIVIEGEGEGEGEGEAAVAVAVGACMCLTRKNGGIHNRSHTQTANQAGKTTEVKVHRKRIVVVNTLRAREIELELHQEVIAKGTDAKVVLESIDATVVIAHQGAEAPATPENGTDVLIGGGTRVRAVQMTRTEGEDARGVHREIEGVMTAIVLILEVVRINIIRKKGVEKNTRSPENRRDNYRGRLSRDNKELPY
jgi:hypothetical protein